MAQTRLMAVMIFLLIVFIVFIGYLIVKCSNKEEPSSAVIIIFILIASAVVGVLGNNIDNVDIALEYPVKKYTMKRNSKHLFLQNFPILRLTCIFATCSNLQKEDLC